MQETIDEQVNVYFVVVLSDAIADKITVMIESAYAFRAVTTVVVAWGFGFEADVTFWDCFLFLFGPYFPEVLGFLG